MTFEVEISYEKGHDIEGNIRDGSIFDMLWGDISFIIDGKSFFEDYNVIDNEQEKMGSSGINEKGLSVPIYSLVFFLWHEFMRIGIQDVYITDSLIDKDLAFLREGDKIVLAIRYYDNEINGYRWYDGRSLVVSETVSQADYNTIPVHVFIEGLKKGMMDFLCALERDYPEISRIDSFIVFKRRVSTLVIC